jgi:hypothetical protein
VAITSVTIGGLEVGTGSTYAVTQSSLASLKSAIQRDPVMIDRPGTYPTLIRSQPQARSIPLEVLIKSSTLAARRTAFNALVAACGSGYPPVAIAFVEDGSTHTWQAHCSGPVPDEWYARASIAAVAANPTAVVT